MLPATRAPRFSPPALHRPVGSPLLDDRDSPRWCPEHGKETTHSEARTARSLARVYGRAACAASAPGRGRRPRGRSRGPAPDGQVALAKATSFIALLRADGRLLDVTDAPLTAARLDRARGRRPPAVADAVVPALRGRAGRPAARRRAGRRRPLRALRRRADDGQRRTVSETVDLVAAPAARRATAASRSSSPRAARSPTASAPRSGSPARTPSCPSLTDRLARIHTSASGCSPSSRTTSARRCRSSSRAPSGCGATAAAGRWRRRRRASAWPRWTRSSRSTRCSSRSAATTARRASRWSTTTSPRVVRVRRRAVRARSPPSAQIKLVVETPDALPSRFDPERISRVISNLLANALRFTPPGGIARCTLAEDGATARARGRRQRRRRAARAARRCCSSASAPPTHGRGRSGTGLGLAIVKEFVQLHGGDRRARRGARGRRAVHRARCRASRPASEPAPLRLSQQLAAARRTRYVRAPGRRAGRDRARAARARAPVGAARGPRRRAAPPRSLGALERGRRVHGHRGHGGAAPGDRPAARTWS